MMRWTVYLSIASLAGILSISAGEVGLFDKVQKTLDDSRARRNILRLLHRDQWNKSSLQNRNQGNKSPLENRNEWIKSPVENRNQWTKSPVENRNQWTKSPLEKRNQWIKSPLENRNQWTKSPFSDDRADLNAGNCSTSYPTTNVILGDRVTFTSPQFPSAYPASRTCGWMFTTDTANTIMLECDSVDIRNNDFLTIADSSGVTIVRYTSRNTAIAIFSTGKSTIKATFSSDKSVNGKGFRCYATALVTPVTTAPPSTAGCVCGKKLNSRIVGGTEASLNEYPWQVGMVYRTASGSWFNFCGGSLISSTWIVTAAHCLSISYVMIGEYDRSSIAPPTEIRPVRQTIKHASYKSTTNDYDIALLRIDPIDFTASPTIRPVCLPDDPTVDYTGQMSTVTGWGTTSSGGSVVDILREVDIPVISNAQCASMYGGNSITARMLCAAGPNGGLDSCQGDSGGPLIVADGANYELAGIVSWGIGCALPAYPGVYTRVTAVLSWITSNTGTAGYCPRA